MPRPAEFAGIQLVTAGDAAGPPANGTAGALVRPPVAGTADRSPPAVLILAGRDSSHPDGGGSELYIERVAAGLVQLGHDVTLFCGSHPGAPAVEWVHGVRVLRRGGRLSVFAHAAWLLRSGRLGRPGVIIDVHNGLPFFSRWYTRVPVIVLVHHVHKEQWRVCFGPLLGRLGWWVESRLAPFAYRRARYVTVSQQTRGELAGLGVARHRIAIVHNGVDPPAPASAPKTPYPSICVLGRLVPNKRVELALQVLLDLRRRHPGLRLTIVGKGYWEPRLREAVARLGLEREVDFLGWVDEATKRDVLARSWVLAMPSLKEGWGLAVMEAAMQGTPAVGFSTAGGITESVRDGETGLLAPDYDGFARYLDRLLTDADLRERLGASARSRAANFTWERSAAAFAAVVHGAAASRVRMAAALRSRAMGILRLPTAKLVARPVTIRNMPVLESTTAGDRAARPGFRPGARTAEDGGLEHMGGSA